MDENPLLPHAELRALLTLTRHCTTLEAASARKRPSKPRRGFFLAHAGREAVLAATTLQLKPGDLLIPEAGDSIAGELAPRNPGQLATSSPILPTEYTKGTSRLLLAASIASASQASGTDRVVLVLTQTGSTDSAWGNALTWAQNRLLPLVFVFTDASGPSILTDKGKLSPAVATWGSVSRHAAKVQLPVLTVDGEDAVAMYRTAQEAILRARTGGGPAILWAALPRAQELKIRSRTQRPVNRLAQYLRSRGIPVV